MNLPEPTANFVRGPKGEDVALKFGDTISFSFWDLWCLIVVSEKFLDRFDDARNLMEEKLATGYRLRFYKRDQARDIHHLLGDLKKRTVSLGPPSAILEMVPEKLINKERAKAKTNILELSGSHHWPSAQMLQAPYRLLRSEAYRGQWDKLPVNPGVYIDQFIEILTPYSRRGYIPADATFKLVRRLEKKIQLTLKKFEASSVIKSHYYAMYRCLLTLYQEQNSWDDSYGEMGEIGQDWVKEILKETPESLSCDPNVHLKDLLMYYCWEDYGVFPSDWIEGYVNSKLSNVERNLAIFILKDIEDRATAAFSPYNADAAKKLRKEIQNRSAVY